jgi:hypothetical protein
MWHADKRQHHRWVQIPAAQALGMDESLHTGKILRYDTFSFYGFQWDGTAFIDQAIAPMTERMKKEAVDAVFLTPA